MRTANAITGVSGHHLLEGFDLDNPPSYSQQWWSSQAELEKPVKFKTIKLGDLMNENGWDMLARRVEEDGCNMREQVEYGMPAGSITRQIRTEKNLYIKRGSVYKVVAL